MSQTSHVTTVQRPIHDTVREYYGRVLSGSDDLKTNACCPVESMPAEIQWILEEIEPEILQRFYGCGSPIPPALDGRTVLDLGCGTGRDAFICSKLVGERGLVIGVDMTDEQLEVGRRHLTIQTERFGYRQPNVALLKGYMEDLAAIGVGDESVDVMISNCVINLSPDKEQVFSEVLRVLRPGGEFYFSDIFADRRVPSTFQNDPELVGECLGGALYIEDFRRTLVRLGLPDFRVVSSRPVTVDNPAIKDKIGMVKFSSVTVRGFKLASLEDRCEDYGQIARYLGTIEGHPHAFTLDDHHVFETGKPVIVCGNTAAMLSETRFADHFRVEGDRSVHFGLFDCGTGESTQSNPSNAVGCC
jgi:SAM-dependent methyltransferase